MDKTLTRLSVSNYFRALGLLRSLFLAGAFLLGAWNAATVVREIRDTARRRAGLPYYFPGLKFSRLEEVLRGQRYVGYLTDKDLDEKFHAMQFSQAQYVLAPVILDLNDASHRYILFDFTSQDRAMARIAETGALPLMKNNFGIILALNPGASPETRSE